MSSAPSSMLLTGRNQQARCFPSTQDTKSRSWLVRTYYRHRLFMGVCCISCEVLYLSVSLFATFLPHCSLIVF